MLNRVAEKSAQKAIAGQITAGTSAKPFFLIWDKVYQKLANEAEEKWLIRATEPVFDALVSEIEKSELLR